MALIADCSLQANIEREVTGGGIGKENGAEQRVLSEMLLINIQTSFAFFTISP